VTSVKLKTFHVHVNGSVISLLMPVLARSTTKVKHIQLEELQQ